MLLLVFFCSDVHVCRQPEALAHCRGGGGGQRRKAPETSAIASQLMEEEEEVLPPGICGPRGPVPPRVGNDRGARGPRRPLCGLVTVQEAPVCKVPTANFQRNG